MECNRYIRVLLKEPNKKPKIVTIENTLENMQELVNGPIEVIYHKGAFIICNEDGKSKKLEPNLFLEKDMILGSFFMVGDDYENADFISLNNRQIKEFKKEILEEMQREIEMEDDLECEME